MIEYQYIFVSDSVKSHTHRAAINSHRNGFVNTKIYVNLPRSHFLILLQD